MKQTVRIIGGKYRGKKITFPDKITLRPTPDRVRETVFNWLMHDIHQAKCLDAFAGSGALGFEAFSRGASQVILLEQDLATYSHLKKIAITLSSENLEVIHANTLDYLKTTPNQYDIIFLDPPYAAHLLPQCLDILAKKSCLPAGGLIYVESDCAIELDEMIWETLKLKQAGNVIYGLFKKR